jgi:hypothetical protein
VGYNNDPSLLLEGTAATLDQLAVLLEDREPSEAAAQLARRFRPTRATHVGLLAAALARGERVSASP